MYRLLITCLFSLTLLSCTEKGTEPSNGFIYPLKNGNNWVYDWIITSTDSLTDQPDTLLHITCRVEITPGEQIFNDLETVMLSIKHNHQGHEYIRDNWYANQPSGLYIYAYRNAGGPEIYPAPSATEKEFFYTKNGVDLNRLRRMLKLFPDFLSLNFIDSDSIYIEDPPLLCLPYPPTLGLRWTYRESENPWLIEKEVEELDFIRVSAGGFICYVIRSFFDMDNDNEYNDGIYGMDWVAGVGVIKRVYVFENVEQLDPQGNILRYVDMKEEYILEDYNIR